MTEFIESVDRLYAALKQANKVKQVADNLDVSPQYIGQVFRTIIESEKRAEALTEREKRIINVAKDICAPELEQARQFENNLAQVLK